MVVYSKRNRFGLTLWALSCLALSQIHPSIAREIKGRTATRFSMMSGRMLDTTKYLLPSLVKKVPMTEWIGKKFIFLPSEMNANDYASDYSAFDDPDRNPLVPLSSNYRHFVGRIGKVIKIGHTTNELGMNIATVTMKMVDNGEICTGRSDYGVVSGIAPYSDVVLARLMFTGKTLWYASGRYYGAGELQLYDRSDPRRVIPFKKYSPVKVVTVTTGEDEERPVRFIVKTASGEIGYDDVRMSNTNTIVPDLWQLEDTFFLFDPRTVYKWSNNVWSAIEAGEALIGMNKFQVEMSAGEPYSINRTRLRSTEDEQWVMSDPKSSDGGKPYLYFTNGVLTAIQD